MLVKPNKCVCIKWHVSVIVNISSINLLLITRSHTHTDCSFYGGSTTIKLHLDPIIYCNGMNLHQLKQFEQCHSKSCKIVQLFLRCTGICAPLIANSMSNTLNSLATNISEKHFRRNSLQKQVKKL